MAMTRQLWSINALATELGRDRRTISRALDAVPPDGTISGHKAWYMATALKALRALDGQAPSAPRTDGGGLLSIIRDRLANWRQIHDEDPVALPIAAVAEAMEIPVAQVLVWLRAGCPYFGEPGNWQNGEGFQLNLAWVVEWTALVGGLIQRSGDRDIARQLNLIA